MPKKYKVLDTIHTIVLIVCLVILFMLVAYALEGEMIMSTVCTGITHFDHQPHTGARVTDVIERYELIPILLLSFIALLVVNKIVYVCTVRRYKNTHFVGDNKPKTKKARKLFSQEAPVQQQVTAEETTDTKTEKKKKKTKKTKKESKTEEITDTKPETTTEEKIENVVSTATTVVEEAESSVDRLNQILNRIR